MEDLRSRPIEVTGLGSAVTRRVCVVVCVCVCVWSMCVVRVSCGAGCWVLAEWTDAGSEGRE
jgi:hypothetical protein